MRLLVEATVVGIALVIFGNIVGFVVGKLFSTDLPPLCKTGTKIMLWK